MRLIDRDDFNALGTHSLAMSVTMNEDGTQDPGPYLYCVNDTGAWVSRMISRDIPGMEPHLYTMPIDTATVDKDVRWRRAVDLWLRDAPINKSSMLRRYKLIRRHLEKVGPKVWSSWDEVYHWPEASDLIWDGLAIHQFITRREINGVREVVITGTTWDRMHREREEAQRV